jgi:hypothetical protein
MEDPKPSMGTRIARAAGDSNRNIAELLNRGLIQHRVFAEPPPKLGRYEIRRKLGEGGMAVVFEAWDPQLARAIAIKVLHADPEPGLIDIQHEARVLAQLGDPAIVTVHDLGVEQGQLYLCMALLEGGDLARYLPERGPVPWPRVLGWFADVARGLHVAHRAGIIHRDVKLENLLLGRDGRVRITDFGLARLIPRAALERAPGLEPATDPAPLGSSVVEAAGPGAPAITWTGVVGTPGYIAPEVEAGGQASARSDQWALCVALDRALVHADGQPPSELAGLLARGTSAAPEQRFVDLDALERELRALLPGSTRRASATGSGGARIDPTPVALARLVELATGARSREEYRREAMAWVDRHVGFDTALFGRPDVSGPDAPLVLHFDPAFVERFAAQSERYAPTLARILGVAAQGGAPVRDIDVYASSERAKIPFYTELIGPKGTKVMAVAALTLGGVLRGTLQISRTARGTKFSDAELELLRQALPILALGEGVHGISPPRS